MIYIYGDSHAKAGFSELSLPNKNYWASSITMFRIGRDNYIINYNKDKVTSEDIVCLVYGEVDCRCHVQKQINLGRNEDDIIFELVDNYFKTIKNNIKFYKKIIVVSVIPPATQSLYEELYGPITHDFPFVGSDEERVRFRTKINALKEKLCLEYGYIYFNPYDFCTNPNGTLDNPSNRDVHIGQEYAKKVTISLSELISSLS